VIEKMGEHCKFRVSLDDLHGHIEQQRRDGFEMIAIYPTSESEDFISEWVRNTDGKANRMN